MTHEERQRAFEAAYVLDVLSSVFAELDQKYVDGWRHSRENIQRDEFWHKQRVLVDVKRELLARVEDAAFKTRGKDKQIQAALMAAKGK
jgi:hypothetical protein